MLLDHDPFHCLMPYDAVPVPHAGDGPLAGLTLAVKDIYDVAGYRTGCGCPLRLAQSPVATVTTPAAQRLLDAGARFVAKAHTDELAWSMYGMNAHFGTPVNPAAPDRIPGGSSSGSAAAVAGGLVDIAIGSDTGGSVRAPASFCAIWGLRPTQDRVPMDGAMAVAPGYDTPGFFTRDGATLGRVAAAMMGEDTATLPETPAFMRPLDMIAQLGPDQRAIYDRTFDGIDATDAQVFPDGVTSAYEVFLTTMGWDAKNALVPWVRAANVPLVHGLDGRIATAERLTSGDFAKAAPKRRAFADHMQALLGDSGVLLAPVVPEVPFRLNPPIEVFDAYRHTAMGLLCVAGLAGLPQVVFPAGRIDGGPFGMSLIGPRGSDVSLIALATRMFKGVAP